MNQMLDDRNMRIAQLVEKRLPGARFSGFKSSPDNDLLAAQIARSDAEYMDYKNFMLHCDEFRRLSDEELVDALLELL